MNSAGLTAPSVGVVPAQQGFASDRPGRPRPSSPAGTRGAARRARARDAARCRGRGGGWPGCAARSLNVSTRARPRSLARFMAASASRSRLDGVSPELADGHTGADGHDPLALIDQATAPRSRAVRRSATSRASSMSARSSHTTTNSSPPKRTTVSLSRAPGPEAPGQLLQHPVAGRMAEAVVDQLEVVDVEEQHADPRARCARRRPGPARGGRSAGAGWAAR